MSFSYHELGGAPTEIKTDDGDDSSKENTKKTGKSAKRLAGVATEASFGQEQAKPGAVEQRSRWHEGFLKKLNIGDSAKDDKQSDKEDKPEKIEAKPDSEDNPITQSVELAVDDTKELSPEESAELKQATHDMIELGLDGIEGELREIPLEDADSVRALEVAAKFDYYKTMDDLAASGEAQPDDLPENAARIVAEHIEAEEPDEEVLDEDEEAEDPAATGAGSNGSGVPPRQPPGGNSLSNPNNPNQPPPPNQWPPYPNNYYGPPGPVGPNVPPVVLNPNVVPSYSNERAAAAQGLLIGAIAGYFIGRHRGRKQGAEANERKAKPIRRSLERRVQGIQQSIAAKEAQIKAMAQEKMQLLQGKKEREQLVTRLLQTPVETVAVKPVAERVAAAETVPKAGILSNGAEILLSDRHREPDVVPFNKSVQEFSHEELMITAQKIKVEGATLKEMVELGQIDEPGLRRVVGEFLKGGDVARSVAREVKEKEIQYERDPRLRHLHDGRAGQASSQAAGAGGLILGGLLGSKPDVPDQPAGDKSQSYDGPHPELDPAIQREIRNRQAATIAVTTVLVILAIIIVIIVTG